MDNIEQLIISAILNSAEYRSKVYPHIRKELFISGVAPTLIEIIQKYNDDYRAFPNREAMLIELDSKPGLTEESYTASKEAIKLAFSDQMKGAVDKIDMDWFFDKSESYLKMNSCHLAVMDSLSILDGENKKLTPEAIPDILKKALSITFDNNVGHDYIEDADARFEFYHTHEQRIPFKLKALNDVTQGGFPRKSLVVPVAPTGVGKSLFLTDWSGWLITKGYDVLYVTLEMAEERIGERIDAALMDVTMSDLKEMPKVTFDNKLNTLKRNTLGSLKIKEYPPGTFNANHLRFLCQDLKNKQNFVPDIIMVDYLNLLSSYRMRDNSNSYNYIKAVTEELRGVAMELDIVICSPTQTNRQGMGATDYELTEISESAGIAMTADGVFGLISSPELEELGHMRIKQLKNRYGDINRPSSFVIGVNRSKMQLYDLDDVSSNVGQAVNIPQKSSPAKSSTTGLKF